MADYFQFCEKLVDTNVSSILDELDWHMAEVPCRFFLLLALCGPQRPESRLANSVVFGVPTPERLSDAILQQF